MRYDIDCTEDGRRRVRINPRTEFEMGGIGDDIWSAAERAFALTETAARSPIGRALPPGTAQAASTVRKLIGAAKAGKLDDEIAKVPAKARKAAAAIISHLASWL